MNSLEGRVILVTGAAKRIGRGIALRLAKEGARVAIHYNGSEAEAAPTAAECGTRRSSAPIWRASLKSRLCSSKSSSISAASTGW